jgi:hypothetical protein
MATSSSWRGVGKNCFMASRSSSRHQLADILSTSLASKPLRLLIRRKQEM